MCYHTRVRGIDAAAYCFRNEVVLSSGEIFFKYKRYISVIFKEQLISIIRRAIERASSDGVFQLPPIPPIKVEYPKEEKFGDYSTPLALESAKLARTSPMEIGQALKPYIESETVVERVDVVKPGFINIFGLPLTVQALAQKK